jgi:hypothetical protein
MCPYLLSSEKRINMASLWQNYKSEARRDADKWKQSTILDKRDIGIP